MVSWHAKNHVNNNSAFHSPIQILPFWGCPACDQWSMHLWEWQLLSRHTVVNVWSSELFSNVPFQVFCHLVLLCYFLTVVLCLCSSCTCWLWAHFPSMHSLLDFSVASVSLSWQVRIALIALRKSHDWKLILPMRDFVLNLCVRHWSILQRTHILSWHLNGSCCQHWWWKGPTDL